MPIVSSNQQEKIFQDYLQWANVSSIEEARNLSTEALQFANIVTVGLAAYGGFTYGPVVDGDFLPALPGQLLARGKFDKDIKVMVGHNANEVCRHPIASLRLKKAKSLTTSTGSYLHASLQQKRHHHSRAAHRQSSFHPRLP